MIPVGNTKGTAVQYVEEHERVPDPDEDGLDFVQRSVGVSVRDWDVSDPEARDAAAVLQLEDPSCPDDPHYAKHAMWFIDPGANAAVLVVFRPKGSRQRDLAAGQADSA